MSSRKGFLVRNLRLREPVNGALHCLALVASLAGTWVLLQHSDGHPLRFVAFALYGGTMCGCFLASTLHHWIRADHSTEQRLLRLDHAAIFPFIAGSYTPICLLMLPPKGGELLFLVVWALAMAGMIYKIGFARDQEDVSAPPDMATIAVYVAMGWLAVSQLPALIHLFSRSAFLLAAIGGGAYTVGGVILGRRWLDLVPGRFGHHEIWHLFVMVGATCIYAVIYMTVLR